MSDLELERLISDEQQKIVITTFMVAKQNNIDISQKEDFLKLARKVQALWIKKFYGVGDIDDALFDGFKLKQQDSQGLQIDPSNDREGTIEKELKENNYIDISQQHKDCLEYIRKVQALWNQKNDVEEANVQSISKKKKEIEAYEEDKNNKTKEEEEEADLSDGKLSSSSWITLDDENDDSTQSSETDKEEEEADLSDGKLSSSSWITLDDENDDSTQSSEPDKLLSDENQDTKN